jgi:hypothetical protein
MYALRECGMSVATERLLVMRFITEKQCSINVEYDSGHLAHCRSRRNI